MSLEKKPFENIVGKGKNAGNQHFLLFLQCFLPFPKQISTIFGHIYFVVCKIANALNLDWSNILSFSIELITDSISNLPSANAFNLYSRVFPELSIEGVKMTPCV